jgi:hypothetical protein
MPLWFASLLLIVPIFYSTSPTLAFVIWIAVIAGLVGWRLGLFASWDRKGQARRVALEAVWRETFYCHRCNVAYLPGDRAVIGPPEALWGQLPQAVARASGAPEGGSA